MANTPICFPKKRAKDTPNTTGWNKSEAVKSPKETPALTKPKSGKTKKVIHLINALFHCITGEIKRPVLYLAR